MRSYVAWVPVLVLGAAAVAMGCAKSPEVGGTSPAGPAVASSTPSGAAAPGARATETPVTPPSGPRETTITAPPAPRETTETPTASGAPGAPGAPGGGPSPLKDIFFEYDKALLTDEAKQSLNENAAWLKANPRVQFTVEGHCDERGTSEYNLALGDRRAKAVREYLVAAGLDPGRIRTISYGKERPFVLGHDESAWRWNRRGHFVLAR